MRNRHRFATVAVALGVTLGAPAVAFAYTTNLPESPQGNDNHVFGTTATNGCGDNAAPFCHENFVRSKTFTSDVTARFPNSLPSGGVNLALGHTADPWTRFTTPRTITNLNNTYYQVATGVLSGTKFVLETQQVSTGSNHSYDGYLNY